MHFRERAHNMVHCVDIQTDPSRGPQGKKLGLPTNNTKALQPPSYSHFRTLEVEPLAPVKPSDYYSLCLNCCQDDPDVPKNIYFCFIDYANPFDYVDHNKLWKILKEMGIPDHLTCLLRNLYAAQEATVRTGHGTTAWFQIGKGVCQGCILSPCLFNLYEEWFMRNSGLDEAQAGIKIAGRNINNLRYADDTTIRAESEELKSLLMKVKEESEKVGLKLNIQKAKIMASIPISSVQFSSVAQLCPTLCDPMNRIRSHHFMANRWGNSGNRG